MLIGVITPEVFWLDNTTSEYRGNTDNPNWDTVFCWTWHDITEVSQLFVPWRVRLLPTNNKIYLYVFGFYAFCWTSPRIRIIIRIICINIGDVIFFHLWIDWKLFLCYRASQWRHGDRDVVSNHRRIDCLLNRLFRRWSMKSSKLHVTGLWEGNSSVTGELPA